MVSFLVTVGLTHLDGSGYLRGDWANIHSSTGRLAYSANNTFMLRYITTR